MLRFIITVIFGFAWWWVYTRVGPGLAWLMILGSVLGVCACCCKGGTTDGVWRPGDFNYQGWLVCIRRCWPNTLVVMVAMFVVGILAAFVTSGGTFPSGADLMHIALAAIFAPGFVRIICCAYD
jgi:hypothetical protein